MHLKDLLLRHASVLHNIDYTFGVWDELKQGMAGSIYKTQLGDDFHCYKSPKEEKDMRMHLGLAANNAVCGTASTKVTTDASLITCKSCLQKLKNKKIAERSNEQKA